MIDKALAAFLQEGLGIHIGTRNGSLEPNGARAVAATVEEDGAHLVVYVTDLAAPRVLPDLESNGQAAARLGRPRDERACQVKGVFRGVRAAQDAERAIVQAQWDGYRASLEQIGIPRIATTTWSNWPAVAIRLQVTAVFNQT